MRKGTEFLKKYFEGKKVTFAEIGIEHGGHFAELYHNTVEIEKAYAIDIWSEYTQENQKICMSKLYDHVVKTYGHLKGVEIIKDASHVAAKKIPDGSLDFVYIDANHQYSGVVQDIAIWVKKVKVGGVIMGHDYHTSWAGVTKAVGQFLIATNWELHSSGTPYPDWWFIKKEEFNFVPPAEPHVLAAEPMPVYAKKPMKILALTWPTFDCEKNMMINQRGDLVCPAIDGLVNEFLKMGHTVVYVNVFADYIMPPEKDLKAIGMISGLPFHLWKDMKSRDFDLIWHAVKDPTPPHAVPYFNKIMEELDPKIPVLNHVNKLKDHTKRNYISLLRKKGVGAIILDNYTDWLRPDGTIDFANKCFPPSQGCYVSKDYHAIRLSDRNSQRTNLNNEGITLKYHNTAKYPGAEPGLRTFFRVPYAAGQCLEGIKYYCPESVLCPKSGAAVKRVPYSIPEMSAGTISAAMTELGIDLAHVEGVEAGFSIEIFDVNPFPSSAGASLQPMSARIAKRIEQVYAI